MTRPLRPDVRAALADPWFRDVLAASAREADVVALCDAATGTLLVEMGAPPSIEIDETAGAAERSVATFVEFVHDSVYLHIPRPEEKGKP